MKAGTTNIRDISYEEISGFLSESCIVELIHKYNSEIKAKSIKDYYAT